jgi:hypothetical protein
VRQTQWPTAVLIDWKQLVWLSVLHLMQTYEAVWETQPLLLLEQP